MQKLRKLSGVVFVVLAGAGFTVIAGEAPSLQCAGLESRVIPGRVDFHAGQRHWANGQTEQALASFTQAAAWGDVSAQGMLGLIHFNGEKVVQNKALGLAWLRLAAESGQDLPVTLLENAIAQATEGEKRSSQDLVASELAAYQPHLTHARAAYRLERTLRDQKPDWGDAHCDDAGRRRIQPSSEWATRVDHRMDSRYQASTR